MGEMKDRLQSGDVTASTLARAFRGGFFDLPGLMVEQRRHQPRLQASQFALFHGPRHGRA